MLSPCLSHAETHQPPSQFRMKQQVRMSHALQRFRQTQMSVGENRILLIRVEGTDCGAKIAAFPVTNLRNALTRFGCFPFVSFERPKQSMRRIDAHGHFAMFETGAPLSGHQIHIITHAIEMRRLSPHRFHTVSAPYYRLARSRRKTVIDKSPSLRINALGPDLGLAFPLRIDRRTGLGPVHIAVPVLEYVWIDAFGALDPERPTPRSVDRVRLKNEVAFRRLGRIQFGLGASFRDGFASIDASDGAGNHVFATNPTQRRRIDATRVIHERNEQTSCQLLIYGIRHVFPVGHIPGNVNRQAWNQFEGGGHKHDLPKIIIPNPTRIRMHSVKNGIGDGNRCGHKYASFGNVWIHHIIANNRNFRLV